MCARGKNLFRTKPFQIKQPVFSSLSLCSLFFLSLSLSLSHSFSSISLILSLSLFLLLFLYTFNFHFLSFSFCSSTLLIFIFSLSPLSISHTLFLSLSILSWFALNFTQQRICCLFQSVYLFGNKCLSNFHICLCSTTFLFLFQSIHSLIFDFFSLNFFLSNFFKSD